MTIKVVPIDNDKGSNRGSSADGFDRSVDKTRNERPTRHNSKAYDRADKGFHSGADTSVSFATESYAALKAAQITSALLDQESEKNARSYTQHIASVTQSDVISKHNEGSFEKSLNPLDSDNLNNLTAQRIPGQSRSDNNNVGLTERVADAVLQVSDDISQATSQAVNDVREAVEEAVQESLQGIGEDIAEALADNISLTQATQNLKNAFHDNIKIERPGLVLGFGVEGLPLVKKGGYFSIFPTTDKGLDFNKVNSFIAIADTKLSTSSIGVSKIVTQDTALSPTQIGPGAITIEGNTRAFANVRSYQNSDGDQMATLHVGLLGSPTGYLSTFVKNPVLKEMADIVHDNIGQDLVGVDQPITINLTQALNDVTPGSSESKRLREFSNLVDDVKEGTAEPREIIEASLNFVLGEETYDKFLAEAREWEQHRRNQESIENPNPEGSLY